MRTTTSSSTSKFSIRMVKHAPRHVGFDLQQRQRAVAQLLQAAVDRLEQVVGLVLLDHHVGVADDAEQVRAFDLRAREELLDVAADHVLEEDVRHAAIAATGCPAAR